MKREENWFLKPPPHTNILMVVEKKGLGSTKLLWVFVSKQFSLPDEFFLFRCDCIIELWFIFHFFLLISAETWSKIIGHYILWNVIKKRSTNFCNFVAKHYQATNVEKLSSFLKSWKLHRKMEKKRLGCVLKHVIVAKMSQKFTHQFR